MGNQYQDSTPQSAGSIESLAKLEATPSGKRDRWRDEITYAEKELKKFHETARRVIRRYIDDRDATETSQKWFNIFNTNVGIMEASLYANIPTVDVSRRFADMNDDVARVAAIVLQRGIQQDMVDPDCDFDQVMRQTVSDRLIPGLGTAWLRLETETEDQPPVEDANGGLTTPTDEEGNPLQRIASQEVCIDYVYWEDFLWSPCRVWAERRWIARRVPMTRDQLIKRFGEDKGKRISLDYGPQSSRVADSQTSANMILKQACIYEIWDRQARKVIWLSKSFETLLDEQDDPLHLEGFEPCPKPLFANLTTSNCLPKPDFAMIQDQYNELDSVNNRISLLIVACKVVGVYDRSADGIQRMLTEGYDNTLIPVDNWAMFAEKGGVKGQIDWLPLDVVVTALAQLTTHREIIKQQIYELTGISDIVRGASKASETLGAQELKGKFAAVRIQKLQDEVTRFAESILRIKGEILVKHFDPMLLSEMANADSFPPEDQQLLIPALQLLKAPGEKLEWRISIQSDAMAQVDHTKIKQERGEFMNAVATFLQSSSTVGQGAPQLIPLMLQMLKFGVSGFKVGEDIEGVFDRYIKEFEQEIEAKKQQPPPPDPEQQKLQAEMQMKQADQQMSQQQAQTELQMKQVEMQNDLAMKREEMNMKLQMMQAELAMKEREWQAELQFKQQEHALKMQQSQVEGVVKLQQAQAEGEIAIQQAEEDHEASMAQSQESHEAGLEQKKAEAKLAKPKKGAD